MFRSITCQVVTEFTDLFDSFLKVIRLGLHSDVVSEDLKAICDTSPQTALAAYTTFFDRYLAIVRTPVGIPQLAVGNKTPGKQLRGMRFVFIGDFDKIKHPTAKTAAGKEKAMTMKGFTEIVTSMGGRACSENQFNTMSEYSQLPAQSYCVLQNTVLFDLYRLHGSEHKSVSDKFVISTRGVWQYIHANYLIEAFRKQECLDPTPFIFIVDQTGFVKTKAANESRHLQRQRAAPDVGNPELLLARSAYCKTRRIEREVSIHSIVFLSVLTPPPVFMFNVLMFFRNVCPRRSWGPPVQKD